jgi:hypothetical protein
MRSFSFITPDRFRSINWMVRSKCVIINAAEMLGTGNVFDVNIDTSDFDLSIDYGPVGDAGNFRQALLRRTRYHFQASANTLHRHLE